jgi:RND family efflux transporter MFP subunit
MPPRAPRPVVVELASPAADQDRLRYSATIQPASEVSLAFAVGGYVQSLAQRRSAAGTSRPIEMGDQVRRGEVLAQIRQTDYREGLARAEAELEEARAAEQLATSEWERTQRLLAQQSATPADLERAQERVQSARARVAAASARRESSRLTFSDTALVAPFDAVVISRRVEQGALAGIGQTAVVIADVHTVKAVFGVPDRWVGSLRVGQPLEVRADSLQRRGTISAIAPSADAQSRVFSIDVAIDNRDGAFRPGMIATVTVDEQPESTDDQTAALSVPLSAVARGPNGEYGVYVVNEQQSVLSARFRPVELGEIAGSRVRIRNGLGASDKVVTRGASLLVDGEPIQVVR